jgi:chloramphenicol-sensitive protein RarD
LYERQIIHGAWFAITAYGFWGISPIYFTWVDHVDPMEIVCQRVVWSVFLLLGILLYLNRLDALRLPRENWWKIVVSAGLLCCNWLVFIYAVVNKNIVETSLGYFINPLVTVFLGMLFLGERLRPLQWIAILIAAAGIGVQLIWFGGIPWIALALAFSFGFYGLTRKNLNLHSVGGLTIETLLIAPFALAYIAWLSSQESLSFGNVDLRTDSLLVLAGFVTSFPLLCFAAAVTRLPLIAAGMFQYIAPSISLIIAIMLYDEPFGIDRVITFTCIWIALAIFTSETLHHHRRLRRAQPLVR